MRVLTSPRESAEHLLSEAVRCDYVYAYPPRQAYRPVDESALGQAVVESLSRPGVLNLYCHVPFCRQICSFCNLYAAADRGPGEHERYVAALCEEASRYTPYLSSRPVDTIYVGGGTPSVVAPALLYRLLQHLVDEAGVDLARVAEVALEVAPDTVDLERVHAWREAGFNRVNLGVQALSDAELVGVGRRHGYSVPLRALEVCLGAGFANVCVDLIYGLEHQSDATWRSHLQTVISLRPPTVCCYPLTLRPHTGFARRGYDHVSDQAQYGRYDTAHELLTDAGYLQETHVRWVLPGAGGYRQKQNHWAGQDVLGLGAGARSYLFECDARNGYSVRHRSRPLASYYDRLREGRMTWTDGYLMNADERRRKAVILGLGYIDRQEYRASHGIDVLHAFSHELEDLCTAGAVVVTDQAIALTPRGQRHRDVLVQRFFSERVRALLGTHSYDE